MADGKKSLLAALFTGRRVL